MSRASKLQVFVDAKRLARKFELPESWLAVSDGHREFGVSLGEAVVSIVDVVCAVAVKASRAGLSLEPLASLLVGFLDDLDGLEKVAERGAPLHELAVEWRTMKRELAERAMRGIEEL